MHTHITRAHLKGYRNIQDTEATFREGLNIIIGPNGCGKSNFLWLLANFRNEKINDTDISAEIDWTIYAKEDNDAWTFKTKIKHQNESNTFTQNFEIKKTIETVRYTNGEKNDDYPISNMAIYPHLIPFNIPTEITCFSNSNSVEINIENNRFLNVKDLGSELYEQINADNWLSKKINPADLNFKPSTLEALKKYTPIQNVRVKKSVSDDDIKEKVNGERKEIKVRSLHYEFQIHNEWFDWRDLSDGTQRVVWIVLRVLATKYSPILLEEPELGIHPLQLNKLMEFIKKESKHKQIIISTHSPEVLNILEADELDRIKLAKYDEVRGTTVIHSIAAEEQTRIGKYMKETGFLSDFWLHLDLEGGTL
jgi:predicted ATPase